jgi:hypothetical protein
LDIACGGASMRRISRLTAVEREVQARKLIEGVIDDYAAHKHPKVKAWREWHTRCTFHSKPTFPGWLNAFVRLEGFCRFVAPYQII